MVFILHFCDFTGVFSLEKVRRVGAPYSITFIIR